MIVGDGDIAKVLTDKDGYTFFASGVSNSKEERLSEFRREQDLLMAQDFNTRLVYFSSLSVFYSRTPYAEHKRKIESYVKMFPKHTIVRIGNIDWGTNPHTIINHFREQKRRGEKLDIQDTWRYIVDKNEFLYWVNMIPEFNCEMNIPGRRLTIAEIVKQYVD